MRISDWSSDVCSSDLLPKRRISLRAFLRRAARRSRSGRQPQVLRRADRGGHRRRFQPSGSERISDSERRPRPGAGGSIAAHRADRPRAAGGAAGRERSEEQTSELQSLMRISDAVFCLKKKNKNKEKAPTRII